MTSVLSELGSPSSQGGVTPAFRSVSHGSEPTGLTSHGGPAAASSWAGAPGREPLSHGGELRGVTAGVLLGLLARGAGSGSASHT
jgi:hypothetical protein